MSDPQQLNNARDGACGADVPRARTDVRAHGDLDECGVRMLACVDACALPRSARPGWASHVGREMLVMCTVLTGRLR